jgi:type I restriction enzyme M protein
MSSNLLFFNKTGRTKATWFYQIPVSEGRKNYSKTRPMQSEEFTECQTWWGDRQENERAWRLPIAELEANGFNLDLRNPNRPDDLSHRPPRDLIQELLRSEREIIDLLNELKGELGEA